MHADKPLYNRVIRELLSNNLEITKGRLDEMKRLGARFFLLIEEFGFGSLAFLSCISARKFCDVTINSFDLFRVHLRGLGPNYNVLCGLSPESVNDAFLRQFILHYTRTQHLIKKK